MNKIQKFAFTAGVSLALAFTLSCSSDDGDDGFATGANGSTIYTESFERVIANCNENTICLLEEDDRENCQENGILEIEKRTYPMQIGYSIANKVLSLTWDINPIKFNGSSNQLEGTWTRTINRSASCRVEYDCIEYDYDNWDWDWDTEPSCKEYDMSEPYTSCDEGYDVTKAVFTQTSATFTREDCFTDRIGESSIGGWNIRAIDCSTLEYSKGNQKMTVKYILGPNSMTIKATYNGKTCTESMVQATTAQKQKACKDAADKVKAEGGDRWDLEDYYYDNLWEYQNDGRAFEKCMRDNNFPSELSDAREGKAVLKRRF